MAEVPRQPAIHALVDVSASMRRTDPANVRVPAVRLLAQLVPEQSRTGIWFFADTVETTLPVQAVDAEWRAAASLIADDVHSRGHGTDIGAALQAAVDAFDDDTEASSRHVLLFTDGQVHLSRDDAVNATERQRIIAELLPAIREAGIHVHAVGLSDEVDAELLQALAEGTGGQLVLTADAEQLERLFLRLFDSVTPRDRVPLEGNRFVVDMSVSELTVVAFRSADAEISLTAPDGQVLTPADAGDAGLRWRREQRYDLITVENPEHGTWQLDGEEDPDNRVLVITDLRLHLGGLPAYLLAGEELGLEAWLTDGETAITDTGFHDALGVTAQIQPGGDRTVHRPMQRDDHYRYQLAEQEARGGGATRVTVTVEAGTFQRQQMRSVVVLPKPATARIAPLPDDPDLDRRLLLSPDERSRATSVALYARVTSDRGESSRFRLPGQPEDATDWYVDMDHLDAERDYVLTVEAHGRLPDEREFAVEIGAFHLPGQAPDVAAPETRSSQIGRPLLVIVLVAFNIALLGVIIIGFLAFRRRTPVPSFDDSTRPRKEGDAS
ncbi:VWA domain-containing protein [Natronocella acetinitrilica]